jgi:hypothetical protein
LQMLSFSKQLELYRLLLTGHPCHRLGQHQWKMGTEETNDDNNRWRRRLLFGRRRPEDRRVTAGQAVKGEGREIEPGKNDLCIGISHFTRRNHRE